MLHGVVVRADAVRTDRGIETGPRRGSRRPRGADRGDIPHNAILDAASGLGVDQIVQPVLAADRIRYGGEPIAIVAAETPQAAAEAAGLVEVEYEEPGRV